jgi:hypothetical protein
MKLTSPAFKNEGMIPSKYTCDGQDVNPPLSFEGIPKEAKSLVLIVDDPDAPMGTWVHWLIWNIAPDVSKINEDSFPEDTFQGVNDFNKNAYSGPCPPSGFHHYHFKLYALDQELGLEDTARKKELEAIMEGHILDSAELIGTYQR